MIALRSGLSIFLAFLQEHPSSGGAPEAGDQSARVAGTVEDAEHRRLSAAGVDQT